MLIVSTLILAAMTPKMPLEVNSLSQRSFSEWAVH